MDAAQGGEPVAVVAAEMLLEALGGVDAEELADTLDGQDLTVAQDWCRAALAESSPGQPAVDQAVHGDEQRRSIHARPRTRGDGLTASVRGSQLTKTRTPG
jgi:hypothetical protein